MSAAPIAASAEAEVRAPARKRHRRAHKHSGDSNAQPPPASASLTAPTTSPLTTASKHHPVISPRIAPLTPAQQSASSSTPSSSTAALPSSSSSASSSSSPPVRNVHRCRFVPFNPSSVTALAFSPSSATLAVGRRDGSISLFLTSTAPHYLCIKSIPGTGEDTVQSLMWGEGEEDGEERLWSAGLNGRIVEWDLLRLLPRHASDSYGGPVWSASIRRGFSAAIFLSSPAAAAAAAASSSSSGSTAVLPSHPRSSCSILLACEDGTLRLFDASDSTSAPTYLRSFSRHPSRILSCCWRDPFTLVSGGADGTVRAWDLASGRNTQRMTCHDSLVWSVAAVGDELISGDSTGTVSVWDAAYGVLRQRFLQHKGDVLALCASADGCSLYAAGADATVTEMKRADGRWRLTMPLRDHTHDVAALALSPASASSAAGTGALLVSGGIDTQLVVRRLADLKPQKLLPFPHRSCVSTAGDMLLVHQAGTLSLYQLDAQYSTAAADTGLTSPAFSHLLDINTCPAAPPSDVVWTAAPLHISCSALSPSRRHIACANPAITRLYSISTEPEISITAVPVADQLPGAYAMCWSADGKVLVVAGMDGCLYAMDVQKLKLLGKGRFHRGEEERGGREEEAEGAEQLLDAATDGLQQRRGVIRCVAVSPDQRCVAACDEHNHVNVLSLPALTRLQTLPVLPSPVTALAFHPSVSQSVLLLTTASNELQLWSVSQASFTAWSRLLSSRFPQALRERKEMVVSISVEAGKDEGGEGEVQGSAVLSSDQWLCMVELGGEVGAGSGLMRWQRRREARLTERRQAAAQAGSAGQREDAGKENFRMVTRYRPLLYAGFLQAEAGRQRGGGGGSVDAQHSDVLVVESPWLRVLQSLPEPMARKRYGT